MIKKNSNSKGGKAAYPQLQAFLQRRSEEQRTKYNEAPNHCKECGNILSFEKRKDTFCGFDCFYKNRRKQNKKRVSETCIFCGQQNDRKATKYCSLRCHADFQWNIKKQKINETQCIGTSIHLSKTAKKYLLETRGLSCEICKNKEWMGKSIPLVIDHINGKAEDWNLSNLRLLCPNCDAQTPTYKGKNKGNGRHWRRQRYQEGKSY
jgi:5-methylcytosine-specific restriction endonuclease McrA